MTVGGEEPRTAGETLYYLPLGLAASGPVTFTPDLMRSSLVEVKAQFFNKDPFNLTIGGGSVTLAYRPIPVAGRLAPTRLAIGVNTGVTGPLKGGAVPDDEVEPAPPATEPAATPAPSGSPATDAPAQPPKPILPPEAMGLPRFELFDREAGAWRELTLANGTTIDVRGPARFVDPPSGTILVRISNDRQDAVGLQLALQLEGRME